jgi:AraC-like DNA-binding protein
MFSRTSRSFGQPDMSDPLSAFFDRVHLKGRLFFVGTVDDVLDLDRPQDLALLHIVERGALDLIRPGFPDIPVRQPSLLLCPSSCRYKLRAASSEPVQLVCGSFDFGESLGRSFPLGVTDAIVFERDAIEGVRPAIGILMAEFKSTAPGREMGVAVLFQYILILLVRRAVAEGRISQGLLASMLDPRIGASLAAVHREPELDWSLQQLADIAGMSRSGFVAHFAKLVGLAPMAYCAAWRMKVAQDLINERVELKVVASAVGYGSQAAFTRAFVREFGQPPAEWRKAALTRPSARTVRDAMLAAEAR